ncbi:hypothetical protein DPW03_08895 [Aggregatibacter aphrophilus]|jgi:hypothetical protein|nr:hypothetical protein DPW03_08895 [Aggregatibacter aphrophilus]
MAYKTGTAQNERDLLDILNKFLTADPTLVANGQAWTVLFDKTVAKTATEVEKRKIVWKSTGTGVEQDIYVMCETVNNIASDIYNLNFFGGTFFNSALVTGDNVQAGIINISPGVVLFADARPIDYYMVADGRCFKVVTRISNVCSSAYCGFILPTVLPTEYPYPLCIAGTAPIKTPINYSHTPILLRYSNTESYNSSIVDPRSGNCWLFTPDQSWRDFSGSDYTRYSNDSEYQTLYPMAILQRYSSQNWGTLKKVAASPGGHYPLYPVEFIGHAKGSQGINRWGAYDGIYWIPGVQRAVGDEVTLPNGNKGVVCNGAFRTTTTDYFVLELGA